MLVPNQSKWNQVKAVNTQAGVPIAPKSFQPMPTHEQISLLR